ncbi:hypothetical protein [Vibrio coralliilyticus]|uniref:hypothetical protein n=1 Tax=Vibrio coralliilyticus TaxID=190893 RepID=UPI00148C611D|nr:hypothetical protein [Vibrio coralliilyticus]
MFDFIKFALIACGLIAVYGLVTGQDLNVVFSDAGEKAAPAAEAALKATKDYLVDTLSK